MKLSFCWITKNEENTIARAIESTGGMADELIVVDTGSTDNTVETAKALGARVEFFEWIDDFAAARNFAKSLATGDVVVMPDADMWFVPPLNDELKSEFETFYKNPGADVGFIPFTDINMDDGLVINSAIFPCVLRNTDKVTWQGAVHENPRYTSNGELPSRYTFTQVHMNHSGYTASIVKDKYERNYKLLKGEIARETEQFGKPWIFNEFFFMRESLLMGYHEDALRLFQSIRQRDKFYDLAGSPTLGGSFFFLGMRIATEMRNKISRRDILENHVKKMSSYLPNYVGSKIIELSWLRRFRFEEKQFSEQYEEVIRTFDPLKDTGNIYSTTEINILIEDAATAAWHRRDVDKCFDLVMLRLKVSPAYSDIAMRLLLMCIRGQSEADTIEFLNAIFNPNDMHSSHMLTEALQFPGYKVIYMYYLKKQHDAGILTKKHYLLLLIMQGSFEFAESCALDLAGEQTSKTLISSTLALTAMLSENRNVFDKNKDIFRDSDTEVLTAYFDGLSPDSHIDQNQIFDYYIALRFLADKEKAETFISKLTTNPKRKFTIVTDYLMRYGLYDEILKLDTSFMQDSDYDCQLILIKAYLMSGYHGKALEMIKALFDAGQVNYSILNELSVLCSSPDAAIAAESSKLHEHYSFLFNERIDFLDVIHTGIVFDDYPKRDRKHLKEITMKEFDQIVESDPYITTDDSYLQVMESAAAVYTEKDCLTMAQHALRRLLSCNYRPKETLTSLAKIFTKIGNKPLAKDLLEWADDLDPSDKPASTLHEQPDSVLFNNNVECGQIQ